MTISPQQVLVSFFNTVWRAALLAALVVALVLTPGALTASTPPLSLGPITIANGLATVSGTLSTGGGATTVSVNGRPLQVGAEGTFAGTVPLNGASSITVSLSGVGSDTQTRFEIPLTGVLLGSGGVIPAGVLDALQQAGASLLTPIVSTTGPLTVKGAVADRSQLASLGVNGKDVLSTLGSDGAFSVQLPGTTKVVTLTATDKSGNVQSTTAGVSPLTAKTVGAAGAIGVRIAKVHFNTRFIRSHHRLRVVVTVRDRLGRLVRGARITTRSAKARRLVRQPKATRSGRKGRATFTLRLRPSALGTRFVLVTVAKTPKAKASKRSAVRLPRAGGRR
jgi:hypothetical protein